jgi:hypothetical protein
MVQDQPEQKLVGIHLNQQMGMVAQSCDPSYTGDRDRKTMVQGQPWAKYKILSKKITRVKGLRAWTK